MANVRKIIDLLSGAEGKTVFKDSSGIVAQAKKQATREQAEEIERLSRQWDYDDTTKVYKKSGEDVGVSKTSLRSDMATDPSGVQRGKIANPSTKVSQWLNDSNNISAATLPKRVKDHVLQEEKHFFDSVPKLDEAASEETISFKGKSIGGKVASVMRTPGAALKDLYGDLVETPTANMYKQWRFGKVANDSLEKARKPLSNQENDVLDKLLLHGDDNQEMLIPDSTYGLVGKNGKPVLDADGNTLQASEELVKSYYTTRSLLDSMHSVANHFEIRRRRAAGEKVLGDTGDILVKPYKPRNGEIVGTVTWDSTLKKKGYQAYEYMDDATQELRRIVVSPEEAGIRVKDIPETFEVIPHREGYIPKYYTDHWAVTRIATDPDGNIEAQRVATAPTRTKATQTIEDLNAKEDGYKYISHRKNADNLEASYGEDFQSIMNNLSPSETRSLKDALAKQGIDPEKLDFLMERNKFFSNSRKSYMMRRGSGLTNYKLDGDAPRVAPRQAIKKYINAVASHRAHAEHMEKLKNAYVEEFGELLANKQLGWESPLRTDAVTTRGSTSYEAQQVRAQINRIIGSYTRFEESVNSFTNNALDRFADTGIGKVTNKTVDGALEAVGKMLGREDMPSIATPSLVTGAARSRSLAARVYLGMFNLSQIAVQSTGFLNTMGYSGTNALRATKDTIAAVGAGTLKLSDDLEAKKLWDELEQSGFTAGFDYVELQRAHKVAGDKILGSAVLKKAWDTNILPWQMGEGFVRATAWFAVRRDILDEIAKGASELTKRDIGTDKFFEAVNRRAMKPALNMSQMNQPLINRGLLGVPFQFKQFAMHQLDFMLDPTLSPLQRMRVGGAWFGAFGVAGIPMINTVTSFADDVYETLTDDPSKANYFRNMARELSGEFGDFIGGENSEVSKFIDRWSRKGAIYAVTDGDLEMASRAGLDTMISDFVSASSLDDLIGGPSYMFLKQWADSNVRNVKDIALMLENNSEFTEEMMFSSLQKITSGVPGLNNPIRALEIERTGQYRDTKGKLIASEVSLRQQLLIATGMGFGERKDFWDAKQANWNQYQAVTDYMDKNAQRLASLYRTDPKSASKMMDEVALEITQVNPLLIRPFLRKFQGKLQEQFADEATLSLHRDFTNMMGSIPDRELREIYNIERE